LDNHGFNDIYIVELYGCLLRLEIKVLDPSSLSGMKEARMKKHPRVLIGFTCLILIVINLVACETLRKPVASQKVLMSQIKRDTAPMVTLVDSRELVRDNSAFALDFYKAVRGQDGNLVFSPYSLSLALAMTYAGAAGDTQAQMAKVMQFTLPQDRLHPAFNALDIQLTRSEESTDDSQPFQMNIANSLWGQQGYPFLQGFLDRLALNYGAGLRLLDFKEEPESARLAINQWVSQQTKEKIKDLIPQGAIDDLTRLVLANAIYFKADWSYPFQKEYTKDQPFYKLDGSQVSVAMMTFLLPKEIPYVAGEGFQTIELSYAGDTASMVILVPNAGTFPQFEAGLNFHQLDQIIRSLELRTVALVLPKFKYEAKFEVKNILEGMGMTDAFDPDRADFSGMDGSRTLSIRQVFHKAFVSVDEKGTEAAAASAVLVAPTALLQPDIQLTVNRPFIFIIRDKPSGAFLFIGRVVNPAQ
jgi:serpin B